MRTFLLLSYLLLSLAGQGQELAERLSRAFNDLQHDEQLQHAGISLYVMESNTNQPLFKFNEQLGLAPASVQKTITAITALEIMGPAYRYETIIGYRGAINQGVLNGDIIIKGSGDPSLGSWRWKSTGRSVVLNRIADAIRNAGIREIKGSIIIDDRVFAFQPLPDGWIWEDIGNYFGSGAWGFNWYENQYDLHLGSGNLVGSATTVIGTSPYDLSKSIINYIKAGPKGSGDNGTIYSTPYNPLIYAAGTIPAGEKDFTISGSVPNPPAMFMQDLDSVLRRQLKGKISWRAARDPHENSQLPAMEKELLRIASPSLDSLNQWFLHRSINLYGEAFIKTFAAIQKIDVTTDGGVKVIRDFWNRNGVELGALNIADGSGLSPGNRVTATAVVQVLQYARKRPWYTSFYEALPVLNGIHMKDGYIAGVRSYAGYIKSSKGREYTFAFLINNFDGSAGTVREKMWKLLDLLK